MCIKTHKYTCQNHRKIKFAMKNLSILKFSRALAILLASSVILTNAHASGIPVVDTSAIAQQTKTFVEIQSQNIKALLTFMIL